MKKRTLNLIMTIVSSTYLIFFVILLIINWLIKGDFSWLDGDILLIIGAISSLLEIIISNRNYISKKINQLLFFNKATNYQVLVSFCECQLSIEEIICSLEKSLCEGLGYSELKRKPISKYQNARWNIFYEGINCQVSCSANCYMSNEPGDYSLEISGTNKYGSINSKKKNILYFATLIKILGNNFFVAPQILTKCQVEKIDVIIKWSGSELEPIDLFSDRLKKVEDFYIKTTDGLGKEEEIIVSREEIKWSTLNSRTLINQFDNFSDIMSSIM